MTIIRLARNSISWRYRRWLERKFLINNFENGLELWHSLVSRGECCHAVRMDKTRIIHPAHQTGLSRLILEVCFDRVYTANFYTPKPNDTVIDAGTNIGMFSLEVARAMPSCRILAFEPFAENFECLMTNFKAANIASVQAYKAALARGSGYSAISRIGSRSQDHRISDLLDPTCIRTDLVVDSISESGDSVVRTYGFDEVLELANVPMIAMFKCDIEGSETSLFSNANALSFQRVQKFAIEWHDHIHPGTAELLKNLLSPTHRVRIVDEGDGRWGMLYAVLRSKV